MGNQQSRAALWHQRRCLKAIAYMDAHLADCIHLPDLALVVGVSVRSLEESFHLHLHKPPMLVLRERRLDRIHCELMHRLDTHNIKSLMHQYGFHHGGDFAKYYLKRFHELPSDTRNDGMRRH